MKNGTTLEMPRYDFVKKIGAAIFISTFRTTKTPARKKIDT